MNIAYEAMKFAVEVHKEQARKYTLEPYIIHLAEVAGIVAAVAKDYPDVREEMIAVAWLHDCVEDQGVTSAVLYGKFGPSVARGVVWLSDMETEGNRAQRKAHSRIRLASAPDWVQTIKCADLISNTKSIVQHDPKFATLYLEEKRLLLDVLQKADKRLHDWASWYTVKSKE